MNFTKKPVFEMIKLGAILAVYAAVSCAVLAAVNNFTYPVIVQNQKNKAASAMKNVFAEADTFDLIENFNDAGGAIVIEKLYAAKKEGKLIGAVAQVSGPTYDHATLTVGLDLDGSVTGVQFLENTDSPGFGLKASDPTFKLENGKTFYGQFTGKKAADGFIVGETFDAISGATITSKAVGEILEKGTACISEYLEEHKDEQ